jgi:serine/threonine protein kinase
MCDDSLEADAGYSAYAADVWAAGVVLHTMMIGSLPFWDEEPEHLFEQIIASNPKDLKSTFRTGISAEYCELLEAMMTPDPNSRPSFEVCEAFAWLQNQSNPENERKLNEASAVLISTQTASFSYTPGDAFYLADPDSKTTSKDSTEKVPLYKKSSSSEVSDTDDMNANLTPEEIKEKMLPPEDKNGHEWKPKFLNKPTFCKICNSFVWGLTVEQQGAYKCKCCKTFGHRHCCRKLSETTECIPSTSRNSIGDVTSLSTMQKHALSKLLSKTERKWDLIKGTGKHDIFSSVVVDAVKAGLHPPPNVNGHVWRSKYLTKPTWCKVCDAFIFGVTKEQQNAYKCFLCKMSAHRDCCIRHNERACTGGRQSSARLQPAPIEESKEKVRKL